MNGWLRRLGRFLGLDRNPLRRPIDRMEARIRFLLVAVLVAGGPVLTISLASSVYDDMAARAAVEQAEFRRTTAVVGRPSDDTPAMDGPRKRTANATVRLPDGRDEHLRISVPIGTDPGARVPVWLNNRGEVVAHPVTTLDANVAAVLVAVMTPLMLITALWLTVTGIRAATIRASATAWDREWLLMAHRTRRPRE